MLEHQKVLRVVDFSKDLLQILEDLQSLDQLLMGQRGKGKVMLFRDNHDIASHESALGRDDVEILALIKNNVHEGGISAKLIVFLQVDTCLFVCLIDVAQKAVLFAVAVGNQAIFFLRDKVPEVQVILVSDGLNLAFQSRVAGADENDVLKVVLNLCRATTLKGIDDNDALIQVLHHPVGRGESDGLVVTVDFANALLGTTTFKDGCNAFVLVESTQEFVAQFGIHAAQRDCRLGFPHGNNPPS